MPSSIPGDNEQRVHVAIIAAAAVLAVVMVAAAVWTLTRPKPSAELPAGSYTQASETSQGAAPAPAASGGATASAAATSASTPPLPGSPAAPAPVAPASSSGHRIAFHIGDSLYIATEDGKTTTPMHVVGTNYALSPDGRTVAAIERGKLVVATVGQHLLASSPSTPGLSAEAEAPVWTADSSGFYFVRANTEGMPRVWRFDRAGGTALEIAAGSEVAVSPDGKTIATMPTEEAATPVVTVYSQGRRAVSITVPDGDPMAVAVSKNRVFISSSAPSGSSTLWSFAYDGTDRRKLVAPNAAGGSSVTYGELIPSPNGAKLLFAADGDDWYSRLFIVPVAGGTPTAISGRRDGYALGWTKDGNAILFIEGNSYQRQSSALVRSDLTGHRRTTLVKGATQ